MGGEEAKKLLVKEMAPGRVFEDYYDKFVIATGASPFIPMVEGITRSHVFFLRNVQNAIAIREFIQIRRPKTAVIAGTGFIGFEMLENLTGLNINVTLVELADKITPNLDMDMAIFLENDLLKRGVSILRSNSIQKIDEMGVLLSDGQILEADMVIMATGVRPNTALAENIGITLGITGESK